MALSELQPDIPRQHGLLWERLIVTPAASLHLSSPGIILCVPTLLHLNITYSLVRTPAFDLPSIPLAVTDSVS